MTMRRALFSAAFAVVVLVGPQARAEGAADCPPEWRGVRPPASELTVCWRLDGENLRVEMSHPGRAWLALGFGESMSGADAIVGRPEIGAALDVFISGMDAESIAPDSRQNVSDAATAFDGARTVLRFTRPLNTGDPDDFIIEPDGESAVIWAAGQAPGFSGHFARGVLRVNWGAGANFAWDAGAIFHAAWMLAAWGLMLPLGVLLARYFKVVRGQDFPRELDNQFWWNWHRILQYGGMLAATAALIPVWGAHRGAAIGWHSGVGFAALGLGWLQALSGVMRGSKGGPVDDKGRPNPPEKIRGDHYDMTLHRRVFESFHKIGGYLAILAGFIAAFLGLREVGAHWSAWVALAAWLCIFAGWFAWLQKSGRWTDTYIAIWGPDERHPGNRAQKPRAKQDKKTGEAGNEN